MRRWAFLLSLIISLMIPAAAAAKVEITPQVGYRAGGLDTTTGIVCLQQPCPSFAESENDLLFGATVDVPLRNGFQFELLLNHQPTSLAFLDRPGDTANSIAKADLDVTHLHAGLLKSWKLSKFEPFVVLGAGQTRLESARLLPVLGRGFELDRFSASLGAGAKIGLGNGERFGVRFEARGYWVDTPGQLMADALMVKRNDFTQFETTTGLTFKI